MHKYLIEEYGGSHGIKDLGALEAALYRPQSGYYDDVIQEAAALWESLTNNHTFIDGNTRVGFCAIDNFLRLNGYRITAKPEIVFKFIVSKLEKNEFEFKSLESWLRNHTIKS